MCSYISLFCFFRFPFKWTPVPWLVGYHWLAVTWSGIPLLLDACSLTYICVYIVSTLMNLLNICICFSKAASFTPTTSENTTPHMWKILSKQAKLTRMANLWAVSYIYSYWPSFTILNLDHLLYKDHLQRKSKYFTSNCLI